MTDQNLQTPRRNTPEWDAWMAERKREQDAWEARAKEELAKRLQDAVPAFNASKDAFITDYLVQVGLAKRELSARLDQVPEYIRKVMPAKWQGFGLIGPTGVGKTCALAAAVRKHAERVIAKRMEEALAKGDPEVLENCIREGSIMGRLGPWFLWVYWPSAIAARRGDMSHELFDEVENWITSLQDPNRLLILDDLAVERQTKGDWAGEVLARVLDERNRAEAPIIWTSNLTPQEMSDRYSARVYSRLHQVAPAIVLPNTPEHRNLRIKGLAS